MFKLLGTFFFFFLNCVLGFGYLIKLVVMLTFNFDFQKFAETSPALKNSSLSACRIKYYLVPTRFI